MGKYLDKAAGISSAPDNNLYLIHGYPGSGKTTVAGTFPKPLLLVEIGADGGATVLKQYDDDNVQRIDLDTSKNIYKEVLNLLDELKEDEHFKTIVFDPYSNIQDIMVEKATERKGSNLSWSEWGKVSNAMTVIRNRVATLSRDRNVVLVLHSKTHEDNDTLDGVGFNMNYPKLTKTNADNLLQMVKTAVYTTKKIFKNEDGTKDIGYVGYIGQHPTIKTKFRTYKNTLKTGFYVRNITYDKISKIEEGDDPEKYQSDNLVENSRPMESEEEKNNKEEN